MDGEAGGVPHPVTPGDFVVELRELRELREAVGPHEAVGSAGSPELGHDRLGVVHVDQAGAQAGVLEDQHPEQPAQGRGAGIAPFPVPYGLRPLGDQIQARPGPAPVPRLGGEVADDGGDGEDQRLGPGRVQPARHEDHDDVVAGPDDAPGLGSGRHGVVQGRALGRDQEGRAGAGRGDPGQGGPAGVVPGGGEAGDEALGSWVPLTSHDQPTTSRAQN
nr:hypothetical protein GCM10020093_065190 [Planobispora longispora]